MGLFCSIQNRADLGTLKVLLMLKCSTFHFMYTLLVIPSRPTPCYIFLFKRHVCNLCSFCIFSVTLIFFKPVLNRTCWRMNKVIQLKSCFYSKWNIIRFHAATNNNSLGGGAGSIYRCQFWVSHNQHFLTEFITYIKLQ